MGIWKAYYENTHWREAIPTHAIIVKRHSGTESDIRSEPLSLTPTMRHKLEKRVRAVNEDPSHEKEKCVEFCISVHAWSAMGGILGMCVLQVGLFPDWQRGLKITSGPLPPPPPPTSRPLNLETIEWCLLLVLTRGRDCSTRSSPDGSYNNSQQSKSQSVAFCGSLWH